MKFAKKIFIYIFLSTALIIFGMSVVSIYWTTHHHKQEVVSSQKKLAEITALKSEDYILTNDRVALYRFFNSIIKEDPYIEYVFVEKKGEILVHTFSQGVPRGLLNLAPLAAPSGSDIIPVEDTQGNLIYHLRTGIRTPAGTTLHFGISNNRIVASIRPLRNLMLIVGIILLLTVPFGLAFFISRFVSKPLSALSKGVKQIGSGELDYRLKITTDDEMEQLGDDINGMAENLERLRNGLEAEIADRMQAENRLAEQTELLNNILSNVPHNIFWKNRQMKYMGCNKAFALACGLSSPDEVIGKTDFDLPWKKEETELFLKCEKKVIDSGKAVNDIEETLTQADGDKKTVIISKVPLKDKNGYIFGILGFYYDITERKNMEEAAKQTQKMEAIGTLAGGIAHDFNNILGGIMGYTELAMDLMDTGDIAFNHLEMVLNSSKRAKDLVRQILAFSRKNQEEKKPIQLSTIVKEEAKLLRSSLPSTIEIRLKIDDHPGMVNADATQMHQVVMNLCTNAAHAMQDKGGELAISLSSIVLSKEDIKEYHNVCPGPFVELKISDTGTGIDTKIIHRIFEPFFTTKGKEKGTGMGLSVVHGIIKDHGGNIFVESHLNKGTSFTVLLPQVISESETVNQSFSSAPMGNEQILFVDDEKMLLTLGEKMLTSLGYKVTSAHSSLEAIEIFQKTPHAFDLVITDHTMPHLTGYNLARRMLEINPSIKVILCTGFSDNITPEKVESVGIKALLYKPISKMDFAKIIRNVISEKNSREG